VINRQWQKGDMIEINFPMKIRKVIANENVTEDNGKLAIERGPVVYCAEGVDNNGQVLNLLVPENTEFSPMFRDDLLNGINVLTGKVSAVSKSKAGKILFTKDKQLTMIPYYAWAHRDQGEMSVWFPYKKEVVRPAAPL